MSDKVKDELRESTCTICARTFNFRAPTAAPDPKTCGRYECIAFGTWPKERWEGQMRMATARKLAGIELNHLDLEAGRRLGVDLDPTTQKEETP